MPRSRFSKAARTGPPVPPPPRRGPSKAAVAAAVVALVSGVWLMHAGTETHAPPAPNASDALPGHHGASGRGTEPRRVVALPPSVPQRIRIPSIKVDAPVMRLDLDTKGALQVPPDNNSNMAGWYTGGAAPGANGSAVMAGHVDTLKGPAVFYNLGSLHKGNTIQVTRADHRTAVFTVYGVEVYSKAGFPADRIYTGTESPELRVITCGGGYSKASHSYLGNVVVYARLTATKTL